MKRKLLSLLLSLIMVVACLPMNIVGAAHVIDDNRAVTIPTISVVGTFAKPGSTVNVDLKIADNPGIAGARITLTYDAGLTLTDAVSGPAFEMLDFTRPGTYASPCNFSWDSESAVATDDGTILTLTFTVAEDVSADDNLAINVSYQYGDIYDTDLNDITVSMVGSYIDVIDFIYGDVNDDGTVNGKDVTLIRRCIAGGYDISINEQAADVNCDGTINGKDVTLIRRYIAGGYDIELPVPVTPPCNHNLEHVEAAPATCTQDGNIEYWHCTICGKCFSDANGSHEITQASTVIPATGHSFSTDWSSNSTYHWHAATCEHEDEMSDRAEHTFNADNVCTVCGYDNNVVPGKPYHIEFRIYEYNTNLGDDYIGTQAIDNSANEEHLWFSSTETFELMSISCPGYSFLGWYTPDGDRMTSVPVGTNHDLILYARWSEVEFDITYRVYLTPLQPINQERYLHYTVSKGLQDLPNPEIYNYIFLGWYTDEGKALTRIPIGTTGDIVLNAFWTSKRNLAKAKSQLENPEIFLDGDDGVLYFAYELGTIENVPLSSNIWTIQTVYGLEQQIEVEVSESISYERADQIASTILHQTVDSNTWSLENNWNSSTHASAEWAEAHNMTQEEADEFLKTSSNTFSLTREDGKKDTYSSTSGTNTVTYDSTSTDTGRGAQLNSSIGGSVKGKVPGLGGVEVHAEIGGGVSSHKNTNDHTGTDTTEVNTTVSGNERSWNNSQTEETTEGASQKNTIKQALSETLTNKYGWDSSFGSGGTDSYSGEFVTTESNSVNSSSMFKFFTNMIQTTTHTYSSNGMSEGCYRLVIAGTIHVVGVVGYDIATGSFFTYTYNVLDSNTYEFLDYSPSLSFNDNEYSLIPFEIPYAVVDYVNQLTLETEGLELDVYDDGTAIVSGYSGTNTEVFVPSYISTGDGDNAQAYRVVGIEPDAFAGKDITAIVLSQYIDSIPDGAFKNCTELEDVWGTFTYIGNEAFSGCTSLENFTIPSSVYHIGADAFKNVPSVTATVLSESAAIEYVSQHNPSIVDEEQLRVLAFELTCDFVEDIVGSGANSLTLDVSEIIQGSGLTINVSEMDSFEIRGKNKTFNDLALYSEADTTLIKNLKIVECTRVPLVIASDSIVFDTVTVESPSFALIAKSPNVNILAIRGNFLTSASGDAIVCKNPTISSELTKAVAGKINLTGNVYVCGNPPVPGSSYLKFTTGEIVYITDEEFAQLIRGYLTVTFDPNDGYVSTSSKNIPFGTQYGELPTPSRDIYSFVGWFTDPEGGVLVNAEDIPSTLYDHTLYAHWELSQYTVYFDANGGSCSTASMPAVIGTAPSSLPTPTRTGYTFAGWYTAASGGTQLTISNWNTNISGMDAATLVNNGLTLYAHWTVNSYTASWPTGAHYTITVNRTSSPNAGASTGSLSNGATVYYGDILTVTYTPAAGFTVDTHGSTSITVTGNVGSSVIYCTVSMIRYTITWPTGTGYSISVNRTSSPIAIAGTGYLSNGAVIYYGDVLTVTYNATTGYTISPSGSSSRTVSGNITLPAPTITPNSYTYTILYRSSHGTDLGSTSATYPFGTTHTFSAPSKTGYVTPASQTVVWDSTSKTITFVYTPVSVSTSQNVASGWWWQSTGNTGIKYSVNAEYQNRTATTIQVRLVWTQSIISAYYGQNQWFNATIGGVSTGDVQIASTSTWYNGTQSFTASRTVYSNWITVSASATTTSLSMSTHYWTTPSSWVSSYWSATMTIPTY